MKIYCVNAYGTNMDDTQIYFETKSEALSRFKHLTSLPDTFSVSLSQHELFKDKETIVRALNNRGWSITETILKTWVKK